MVNSCFEFENGGQRFLCHFDDILDATDSDDLSFYTYPKCPTAKMMKTALFEIMTATEKYYSDIVSVAKNDNLKSMLSERYSYEGGYINKIENALDTPFITVNSEYGNDLGEYKRYLKTAAKMNKLDDCFEKRAYRVLSKKNYSEIKAQQKELKDKTNYSKNDKLYMYIPYVFNTVIFGALISVLGIVIEKHIYSDWIGKDNGYTWFVFLLIGLSVGVIFTLFFGRYIYRLIVPNRHYEEFAKIIEAESVPKSWDVLIVVLLFAVCLLFFTFMGFNGMAVTADGEIVNKDYAFSKVQHYSLQDTDIALLTGGYDDDGYYYDYDKSVYAFCLDGEWVEFNTNSDEAISIIEDAIDKYDKQVITADSAEELDEQSLISKLKDVIQ